MALVVWCRRVVESEVMLGGENGRHECGKDEMVSNVVDGGGRGLVLPRDGVRWEGSCWDIGRYQLSENSLKREGIDRRAISKDGRLQIKAGEDVEHRTET
jgi:hypothetical protein